MEAYFLPNGSLGDAEDYEKAYFAKAKKLISKMPKEQVMSIREALLRLKVKARNEEANGYTPNVLASAMLQLITKG